MYFVLNHSKNIIALDKQTLELFHAINIMELYQKISNGFVEFYIKDDLLAIISATSSTQYQIEKIDISGLLGENELIIIKEEFIPKPENSIIENQEMILDKVEIEKIKYELDELENQKEPKNKISIETETKTDIRLLEIETKKIDIETPKSKIEHESKENPNKELLDLLGVKDNTLKPELGKKIELEPKEQSIQIVKPESKIELESSSPVNIQTNKKELEPNIEPHNKSFKVDDLVIVKNNSTPNISISTPTISKPIVENKVIQTRIEETAIVDLKVASELCGLSQDDYKSFFGEYLQTAQKLKSDIMSSDVRTKNSAIDMIIHLSKTLHAPSVIIHLAEDIQKSSSSDKIEKLYKMLNDVSAQLSKDNTIDTSSKIITETKKSQANNLNIDATKPSVAINNQPPTVPISNATINVSKQAREINLDSVAPNRFEFSIAKSSEELSLPQDIIKDFMKDFTEQCRTETQNIIEAYKAKDMDKIKRISHSLKGVAGNLYLTPLSESLLHIQHNDDISKVPALVEQYWARFISFENQIKNM